MAIADPLLNGIDSKTFPLVRKGYDPDEVRSRYTRWDDFAALAARFDPERRLVNPYLERLGL